MNSNLGQKIKVSLQIQQQDQSPPSPTFGTGQPVKNNLQGIQKVGKHGTSHHEYIKVMNSHKPVQTYRKVSLEELSQHNTKQSAWLSLDGVVYDVTVYMKYHPGGDILLKGCGKKCDQLFYQYHPWVNGKHLLEKYKVGFLG